MVDDEVLRHYRTLFEQMPWLGTAFCWSVVEAIDGPISAAEVVTVWGGSPDELASALPGDAKDAVHLIEVSGSVLILDLWSYEPDRPEVLRLLSSRGRAQTAYWDVNGRADLQCAHEGQVVAGWSDGELETGSSQPELLRAFTQAATDPSVEDIFPQLVCAGLESLSGVRLEERHLREPQLTLPATPTVPRDRRPSSPVAALDAEVDFALRRLDPDTQRQVLATLVRRCIQATGLEHPAIRRLAALIPADDLDPNEVRLLLQPVHVLNAHQQEVAKKGSPAAGIAGRQYNALWALIQLCKPPGPRQLSAFTQIWSAFGPDWSHERRVLLDELKDPEYQ